MSARSISAQILTPDDVVLNLKIAPWHARLVAFIIDVVAMVLCLSLLSIIVDAIWSVDVGFGDDSTGPQAQLASTVRAFLVFVVNKFYFIFFELKWSGQTPGKRLSGIRVIMRDGSPLESGSVVVRNLTRDLETLFPVIAVLSPSSLGLEGAFQILLFWVWLIGLSIIPFLNRHHYRLGDLVARTMVVRMPRAVLLADLSAAAPGGESDEGRTPGTFQFTREQLEHYGAEELHVLEDVLRFHDDDQSPGGALITNVAARISARIGWADANPTHAPRLADHPGAHAFLSAFYRAQREHLEARLRLKGRARN